VDRLAKWAKKTYIKSLSDEKFADHFSRKHFRGSNISVTFEADKGFQIIENGTTLNVARRTRLNYYKNGIIQRLEFLKKEYLGDVKIEFEENDIIVDCGSNIGEFICSLNLNESHRIFAFEPDPTEYGVLISNIGAYATVLNKALWNEDDKIKIYLANESGDSGIYQRRDSEESIEISACRLDSLISKTAPNGVIRLIKIEAEGAEPEVLSGALGLLERTNFITVDVGPERGVDKESTLVPILNILCDHGFEMINFNPNRITCLFRNARFKH
jgi:FkbM family methyltransferase